MKSNAYKNRKKEHKEERTAYNRVKKLDCIEHVQKWMGTGLRDLKKKTKGKLDDGKSVGGKGNRLSDKTIDKLQEYYGKASQRNVNWNAKSTKKINCAIKNMQTAVFAVIYHCVRLP